MAAHDYEFQSHWRVKGTVEEVSAILDAPLNLPFWWPQVYLSIREEEAGVYALQTRSWLPYHLRWKFHAVESRSPYGFTLHAWGDLEGVEVWDFQQDRAWVDIRHRWTVRASKPLLRYLPFVMKPLFAANHRWAMARGEESLVRELARRRGRG